MSNVKHFNHTEHGNIRVALGHDEDDLPEVRFHFSVDGIGEASVALCFQADEESVATNMFERVDEEVAAQAVQAGTEQIRQLHGDICLTGSVDTTDHLNNLTS